VDLLEYLAAHVAALRDSKQEGSLEWVILKDCVAALESMRVNPIGEDGEFERYLNEKLSGFTSKFHGPLTDFARWGREYGQRESADELERWKPTGILPRIRELERERDDLKDAAKKKTREIEAVAAEMDRRLDDWRIDPPLPRELQAWRDRLLSTKRGETK
jgi:hypothetical protein